MSDFPTVLILAGGMGTRLRTLLGDVLPKSMVRVNGQPFVCHQMRLLARQGAKKIVFCVGHLAEPLMEYLGDGERFGLQIEYSFDGDKLLGTGGAIKNAGRFTGDQFAVIYGDSYLDVPFKPIYEAFVQSGKQSLMTVFRNENKFIKSNILFRDGSVIAYDKSDNAPPDMAHVDFGLSFYQRSVFDHFDKLPLDLAVVTQWLIENNQLAGYEVLKRFYEVGTPEGVRDLEMYLACTT